MAEAGAGQQPILILHGFAGAKEDFTDWLDPLAGLGWHTVAPDHRGHGQAAKPGSEGAYSFEILADDALGLADALGWPRFSLPWSLDGRHGGPVRRLRSPGRLNGLVLMDTDHGPILGLDPQAVGAAVSIVRSRGIDALADLASEHECPLDTPAHRRLVDSRPRYEAFGERRLRATSPAIYSATAPAFLATDDRLDRFAHYPVGADTGNRRRAGRTARRVGRAHGRSHPGRPPGHHPRRRSQPAVQEPRRVVGRPPSSPTDR